MSIDPLAPEYPFYSPYAFSGNRVIDAFELEGLEPHKLNDGTTVNGPYSEEAIEQMGGRATEDGNFSITSIDTDNAHDYGNTLGIEVEITSTLIGQNALPALYSGGLRLQYAARVNSLRSQFNQGSVSNPKPWDRGLKARYDIKSQTQSWMRPTPSMYYAFQNAHNPDKYKIFPGRATPRFRAVLYTTSSPRVAESIKTKGRPLRFYSTDLGMNTLGAGSFLLGAYGVYSSYQNIRYAENKGAAIAIEGGRWTGAYFGAEIFGGITASVFPHPYAVGGMSLVGGIIGGIGGERAVKAALEGGEDRTPSGFGPGVRCHGNYCIAGSTLVHTPFGQQAIETIVEGDSVLSYHSGNMQFKGVKMVSKTKVDRGLNISTSSGQTLTMTESHLILVDGIGFLRADELLLGMSFRSFDGDEASITTIRRSGEMFVYNLLLDSGDCFLITPDKFLVKGIELPSVVKKTQSERK